MSDNSQSPLGLSVRGIGIMGLCCGSVIAFLGVVAPLWGAHHAQTVTVSTKATGITPLVLALGAVYTFFPEKATALLGHPQKPTVGGWIFTLVFVLLGIPLWLWLKSHLAGLGYQLN